MILEHLFTSKGKKAKKSFKDDKNSEKASRSIVKAISWRIIGTLDTIVISWFITGEIALALSIGLVEVVTKMILYFFHERIWNIITWGKQ